MALFLFFRKKGRKAYQPLHRRGVLDSLKALGTLFKEDLWKECPAALFAFAFAFGAASALFWEKPFHLLYSALFALYLLFLKKHSYILILIAGYLYSHFLYAHLPQKATLVAGRFSAHNIKIHKTPFQTGLLYIGELSFQGGKIPCSIFRKEGKSAEDWSNREVFGELKKTGCYRYSFKPQISKPLPHRFSLSLLRFHTKKRCKDFLFAKVQDPKAAHFLTALLTGDIEDRLMRYEFSKVGLAHILAVSGFHFATLFAALTFFLRFFLSRKLCHFALAIAALSYYLFIGSNPAVFRSWMAVELYILAKLLKKNPSALNILGVAFLIETTLNPLILADIGFQLSFASCFGILLAYPFIEKGLKKILPERSDKEWSLLERRSKLAAVIAKGLRSSSSITLSVTFFILPLLLYHFHSFPFLSLFYNLFFPYLTSVCLILLLMSFLFFPLFAVVSFFTSKVLDLVSYPPPFAYTLYFDGIDPLFFPPYFAVLALVFLALKKRQSYNRSYF